MTPIYSLKNLAFSIGYDRRFLQKVAGKADTFYHPFPLERSGKRLRVIDNPTGFLKTIQQSINEKIFSKLPLPDFFHGGIKGKSYITNASCHVGQDLVITVDVKSCFESITNRMVFSSLNVLPCFEVSTSVESGEQARLLSPTIARLLTRLTTHRGHVPYGAPTSTAIANLVLAPIVKEVNSFALDYEVTRQTQLIDDGAFSGSIKNPGDLLNLICKEFSKRGLSIGRKKIHVMRANKRQLVNQHVVNKKVSVPRSKRENTRTAAFQLSMLDPSHPEYARLRASVKGRINHIAQFHPHQGEKLARLIM